MTPWTVRTGFSYIYKREIVEQHFLWPSYQIARLNLDTIRAVSWLVGLDTRSPQLIFLLPHETNFETNISIPFIDDLGLYSLAFCIRVRWFVVPDQMMPGSSRQRRNMKETQAKFLPTATTSWSQAFFKFATSLTAGQKLWHGPKPVEFLAPNLGWVALLFSLEKYDNLYSPCPVQRKQDENFGSVETLLQLNPETVEASIIQMMDFLAKHWWKWC